MRSRFIRIKTRSTSGYAALTVLIFVLFASMSVVSGFVFFTFREVETNRAFTRAIESRAISESGIEDGLWRVLANKKITSGEQLTVGNGATTLVVTTTGTTRVIRSEGIQTNAQQNWEVRADLNATGVNFIYGVQVGDGGLEMQNNASIAGSVYSNGNIMGSNGATITGDAFAAVGTPPVINQSWETQNAEVNVGIIIGNIRTIVDATGDVGTYTSLALGPDGFARMSYIDNSNADIKFARCTNADCSAKQITTIDATGFIDEVTSLTMGADGFARMSYYHDGNDDLKFIQCLDADCATRNTTIVDAASNVGDFSDVAMGLDGFPRIAYWYDASGDVRYARCTNADCTTKVITNVEISGNNGEYISLVIGADGFARMSYYDATNKDLKFARCTNDDCTTKIITAVDTTGDVGKFTSLAIAADGLARISYYRDDTTDDLKFARCTNDDCTTSIIATVDTAGTVGQYTSLAIGMDQFARISYFYDSSDDLKFARCTNDDCTAKIITTLEALANSGSHTSLALGTDGFARISYYDITNHDLKFAQCFDADCTATMAQIDVAQSFQPTLTDRLTNVELFLKKVGSPADATIRIIRDSAGSPSTNPADVLSTAPLIASTVTDAYTWINMPLPAAPNLTANTTYWIVIDASTNNNNYFRWGLDAGAGYTRGSAKRASDWQLGAWLVLTGDLNFRAYMGGVYTSINRVTVGANANGHTIDTVTVGGNANAFTFTNGVVAGNLHADAITTCTVNGNATYNTKSNCIVLGNETTPTTAPADPPVLPLPISDAMITKWKNEAQALGTIAAGNCTQDWSPPTNPYTVNGGVLEKNLVLTNNQILILKGTVWVKCKVSIDNGGAIRLDSSYAAQSGLLISDGPMHLQNNGVFQGSGTAGSYLMLLTTASGSGHHGSAIDLHNNASGAIFYAQNGMVQLHNNVEVIELVGYKVHLEENATVVYNSGLANAQFSAGPTGGYDVKYWRETE